METGGPFSGLRVIELAGIGPAQYGCMLLADLGADVIRVDRPPRPGEDGPPSAVLSRGRRSVVLDLKRREDRDLCHSLADQADVLVDPFRPGVTDRLGLGADRLTATNRRLIYAQMTGWGQEGPLASVAGHDVNYLALSGALGLMGEAGEPPPVPLNVVGDFGGGGMLLAFGIAAALVERGRSGIGQVLDVAMIDGVVSMLSSVFALRAEGSWTEARERNWLQGAAPWYGTYRTSDDRYLSVGPLEAKFYARLLEKLDLPAAEFPQWEEERWPELRRRFAEVFASRPLRDWREMLESSDVCFAPILDLAEAEAHPQLAERGTFERVDGQLQATAVPRFSRTPGKVGSPSPRIGEHTAEVLAELDLGPDGAAAGATPATAGGPTAARNS